ncbi:Eukaryotic aspartyl protease family protein [Rhynchospora pubera]|uniref:Eukaryotic aspartyl protease family protein n=1 Tax=Rhynchospora pubera TaxID=906938 RepID=A0AAV8H8D8_9POAL|nr:Eukaryotic aspartyl protease family protein [Rhynchospora pubera]
MAVKMIKIAISSIAFLLALSAGSNAINFQSLSVHELAYTTHEIDTSHSTQLPSNSIYKKHQMTLQLVHRDKMSIHGKKTYWHLFQEQLIRDSKRLAGLYRQLKNSSSRSSSYELHDFGSAVVSGVEEGIGEYFVKIGIGSPPVDQYMVVDTGSDVTWVQCEPCTNCYNQADPIFDPAGSASFTRISCGSVACGLLDQAGKCGSGQCQYEVTYEDGSYTKGTLALENLKFGSTEVENVAIGCGHHNLGLFAWASGLLGLGGGVMSLVGQLGSQTGGAFGYCLASPGSGSDGSLVFGRDAGIPTGAIWVPLVRNPLNPRFYYVGLVGLGVGGVRVVVPEEVFQLSEYGDGGAILDTGTAVTRLPVRAYENLREAFVNSTIGFPRADSVSLFDTCYDLSGFGTVRVPTISFFFSNGPELTLPAKNYLIPVDVHGTFCLAFAPSDSGLSIVGNIQQKGIQVSFDTVNGLAGFGPDTC